MRIKIFIISFFLIASSLFVNAQEVNHAKKFNIGAEGGVQITNLQSFLYPYSPSSKTGFFAGIFGEYNISRSFKVRLGLQYDQRNFEMYGYTIFSDSSGSIGNSYYLYQVDYSVNYLTIPLNINFERGSDKFKVYLQGGLYYSFYLNATQKGVEGYYIDPDDNLDLSGSVLHEGANEYYIDGSTEGISFVKVSDKDSEPGNESYEVINFNFYDFGFTFFVGLIYQPTPAIGLTIGPGFAYSFANAFEDPAYNFEWQQMTRFNIGFIYTLNTNKKVFGQ